MFNHCFTGLISKLLVYSSNSDSNVFSSKTDVNKPHFSAKFVTFSAKSDISARALLTVPGPFSDSSRALLARIV